MDFMYKLLADFNPESICVWRLTKTLALLADVFQLPKRHHWERRYRFENNRRRQMHARYV